MKEHERQSVYNLDKQLLLKSSIEYLSGLPRRSLGEINSIPGLRWHEYEVIEETGNKIYGYRFYMEPGVTTPVARVGNPNQPDPSEKIYEQVIQGEALYILQSPDGTILPVTVGTKRDQVPYLMYRYGTAVTIVAGHRGFVADNYTIPFDRNAEEVLQLSDLRLSQPYRTLVSNLMSQGESRALTSVGVI